MEDKERIIHPSLGSNDLGMMINDPHPAHALSCGTNTLLHMAVLSGKKNKKVNSINDDESVVKNKDGKEEFLENTGTDK